MLLLFMFINIDMLENCLHCMALEMCVNSKVKLTLRNLFNASLLDAQIYDINATVTTIHLIMPSTPVESNPDITLNV